MNPAVIHSLYVEAFDQLRSASDKKRTLELSFRNRSTGTKLPPQAGVAKGLLVARKTRWRLPASFRIQISVQLHRYAGLENTEPNRVYLVFLFCVR